MWPHEVEPRFYSPSLNIAYNYSDSDSSAETEIKLINYFNRRIIDGIRGKPSILLPQQIEHKNDGPPIINFEDSTIERAFVYRHDNRQNDITSSPPEKERSVIEKAVLMTMVDLILEKVEKYVTYQGGREDDLK